MKKVIPILILACFIAISGCSGSKETVLKPKEKLLVEKKENQKTTISSNPLIKRTNNEKKKSEESKTNKEDMTQVLELDHLKLTLDKNWTVNKGLDSASFQLKGKAIGGIDGLGYADSIESLLPNQSKILEKKEIKVEGIKTYSVTLERDTIDGTKAKEMHIIYLIPVQRVAYDLHFDLASINESNVLKIAGTAKVK
jgi:hypothetical protein